MSELYLYDDAVARRFEPFALTRPVAELRAGALLVRERWERAMRLRCAGFVSAVHLADFEEPGAASAARRTLGAGSILANARALPSRPLDYGTAWRVDGRVAAVRLAEPLELARLADGALALDSLVNGSASDVPGRWLDAVWDLVRELPAQIAADIAAMAPELDTLPIVGTIIGSHPVHVERGATVEPHVVFDAAAGPILVRHGAVVQAFTRLVGPCYIGPLSVVAGDRVAASAIGDTCKVRGEVNHTVFLGHANKGHDGFVGHSYLGRWVNLGASTVTSNLKNTYGTVQLWTPDGVRDTGLQFLGTLFGDHAKTGIGLRLTTGTVLGAGSNVFDAMPPKVVPPFAWGSGVPYTSYRLEKFVEVAERAMSRRQIPLGARTRRQLEAAYGARWDAEAPG